MSRVITIVGASARAAAQSAVRAGFAVHAADLFCDADLARLASARHVEKYPHDLANVIRQPHPGGWMYTGGLENYPALVNRWACFRPLWGNGGAVLRNVRQPKLVANHLNAAGLRAPAARWLMDPKPQTGRWLHKPLRSAGGTQIELWDEGATISSPSAGFYLQEYIEGQPYSAVHIGAAGQATLLGITRQLIGIDWTGAAGYRYCGSIGPLPLACDIVSQFVDIGAVLANAFGLVGLFGVDAIVNSAGVWPVEVNPRYTASVEILERACDLQAIAMHVAACESRELPARNPTPARCGGKAILFASRDFRVSPELHAQLFQRCRDLWPAVADIPAAGTEIRTGWPVVSVLVEAGCEGEVLKQLREQTAHVRGLLPP